MVFYWSLSDSTSPKLSRTILSILANLKNVIDMMVSIRPLISKSSSPSTNSLGIVPNAPKRTKHKIFWDYEKQTDNLIQARRPYLVLINKKKKEIILWFSLLQWATERKEKKTKR